MRVYAISRTVSGHETDLQCLTQQDTRKNIVQERELRARCEVLAEFRHTILDRRFSVIEIVACDDSWIFSTRVNGTKSS